MTRSLRAPLGAALLLACTQALAQDATTATATPDTAPPAPPAATVEAAASSEQAGTATTLAPTAAIDAAEPNEPATASSASSGFRGVGIGARISTLGAGLEAVFGLHERVNLRLQGNLFNYDDSLTEDDISYEGDLKLQTFGALLDIHPFAGGLRLTAGAFQNGNQIDLEARCVTECEVGDLTISSAGPTDNPRIFGRADFKSFAPYFGLGYGNAMRGSPLHFAFDVGVLLQGSPRLSLDADGTATVTDNDTGATTTRNLATDPEVQGELQDEARNAEDDAKEFKYYPVISLTIGYRFDLF